MSYFPDRPRLHRSYSKGYAPRRDRHFKYDSTIRDTGKGSARFVQINVLRGRHEIYELNCADIKINR